MKNSAVGKWAEDVAAHFLKNKRHKILNRNFNSRFGEIDIILQDNSDNSIVFVEVRYRAEGSLLLPEETITNKKRQCIKRAASIYLNRYGLSEANVRFDVVCVSRGGWFEPVRIEHIVDVF